MGREDLYILTKNGDVYKYTVTDYENKKYTASKMNDLTNIIRFVDIFASKVETGVANTSFGVINKDGNYKNISNCDL